MISISPLEVFLWTFRKSDSDIVKLYSSMSPLMQLATGGNMLNFGYWDRGSSPLQAQENLCKLFGDVAELSDARTVLDVGSGLGAPAAYWKARHPHLDILSINLNFGQLCSSAGDNINAASTRLPFARGTADRILALESAQHFKPLSDFVSDSKDILRDRGLLVLAIPVTLARSSLRRLGILRLTWSSEHYALDYVRSVLDAHGFEVADERLIGSRVYEPLADYYEDNRELLRPKILGSYPGYVEEILHRSLQRMRRASRDKVIDYALIKCRASID